MIKKKFIVVLSTLSLFILFLAISNVGSVDAVKYEVIDEGIASYKNNSNFKIYWKVNSSTKQSIIYSKNFKENEVISNKKTVIKKVNKNKLKLIAKYIYKNNTVYKNKIIKSKLSPKDYYLNKYKVKMLKNVKTKKIIDNGHEKVTNFPHGYVKWNSYLYYNKKILVFENIDYLYGNNNKITLIEKIEKNKLKITTQNKLSKHGLFDKNQDQIKNMTINYLKSNLTPKDYYFKIHKPLLFKYIPKNNIIETCSGLLLENPKTELFWVVKYHMNNEFIKNKVSIYTGFSLENLSYEKTIIEKIKDNQLKITYVSNKVKEITYITTKLSPINYYYNQHKQNIVKLFNETSLKTITQIQ